MCASINRACNPARHTTLRNFGGRAGSDNRCAFYKAADCLMATKKEANLAKLGKHT